MQGRGRKLKGYKPFLQFDDEYWRLHKKRKKKLNFNDTFFYFKDKERFFIQENPVVPKLQNIKERLTKK